MSRLKSLSIQVSARLGLHKRYRRDPRALVTSLLYHGFVHGGESLSQARSRLRDQLRWLTAEYQPVSLEAVLGATRGAAWPRDAVLITIDDVNRQVLDVMDIFQQFGVSPALFACVGWVAGSSPLETLDGHDLLARAVSGVHGYRGPVQTVRVAGRMLTIDAARRDECCETLIACGPSDTPGLRELCDRLLPPAPPGTRSTICDWSDLQQLVDAGASIGAHSISHARMTSLSSKRLAYELHESRRRVEHRFGSCHGFAYPFGVEGSFDGRTRLATELAGYQAAFTTEPGFATPGADRLVLPRFALPDADLSMSEFRARVLGGGIAVRKVSNWAQNSTWPASRKTRAAL